MRKAGSEGDRHIALCDCGVVLPVEGIDPSERDMGKGIVFIQLHGGFPRFEGTRHFGVAVRGKTQDDVVVERQGKPRVR